MNVSDKQLRDRTILEYYTKATEDIASRMRRDEIQFLESQLRSSSFVLSENIRDKLQRKLELLRSENK